MPSSVKASRAFLLSEERKLIMYIDEKINNSKSNKILVVGQPMSGMTFSACKYAVEQAYLGKTVFIFRDTKQQLTVAGGLNDTLKRVQDAYRELRGEYSGEILTRSIQSTDGRGCIGEVMIYDNCKLYNNVRVYTKIASVQKEIIMSHYKDIKSEYSSFIARGYEVIEATTEENIAGVKNNPAYLAHLHSIQPIQRKEIMELPSELNKPSDSLVLPPDLAWGHRDTSTVTLTSSHDSQDYIFLAGGNKFEFKTNGDVVVNNSVTVTKGGKVIVNRSDK